MRNNTTPRSVWNDMEHKIPFELDVQALVQFTTCAFITSPLTFLWLEGLESLLPGFGEEKPVSKDDEIKKQQQQQKKTKKLNVRNTAAKVLIDQTIGGAWITMLFIVTMGTLRGLDYDAVTEQIQNVGC